MLETDALKTIQHSQMLDGARSICAACSGGPDSTALLHFLAGYAKARGIQLSAAHVNHGLRGGDSIRDREFVRKLAHSLNISFYFTEVNVRQEAKLKRLSIEEAARDLRYAYLAKLAEEKKFDVVLLAHTLDDQAETVLMRVLSGSGLQGLGGSRTVFVRDGIKFARPFIDAQKSEILQFLRERKIKFRKDKSNESAQFIRNRIRLKLIPFLEKKFSPGIKRVLARLPKVLAADIDFLNSESKKHFKRLSREKGGGILFQKQKFMKLSEAIQFRLIQTALKKLKPLELESKHWFLFRSMLAEKPKFKISFPGSAACAVSKSLIEVSVENPDFVKHSKKTGFEYALKPGQKIKIPESGVAVRAERIFRCPKNLKKSREDFAVVDASRIRFPLEVRNRRPGDLFQPLGQPKPGKLKDFLIRRKIPQQKRAKLPLVFSGRKLIWVAGVALSDSVKVRSDTRDFLKLSVIPT